jgi:hypothetical protein
MLEKLKHFASILKSGCKTSYVIIFNDKICYCTGKEFNFIAAGTEHKIYDNTLFQVDTEDAYLLSQREYIRLKKFIKILDINPVIETVENGIKFYIPTGEFIVGARKHERDWLHLAEKEEEVQDERA